MRVLSGSILHDNINSDIYSCVLSCCQPLLNLFSVSNKRVIAKPSELCQ